MEDGEALGAVVRGWGGVEGGATLGAGHASGDADDGGV